MKKIITLILCSTLAFSVLATPTSSAVSKHKHHRHKHAITNNSHNSHLNSNSARIDSSGMAAYAHQPRLYSYSAYAVDAQTDTVLINKNSTVQLPIASISKLMMAMVLLDSGSDLDEYIQIAEDDVDHLRNTSSRLKVGMQLRRRDLLLLALMSSENRASFALARTAYPGGIQEFIRRMNAKCKSLGMNSSQFFDPTGLTVGNKSTATDLAKMVQAAFHYDLIRADTTTKGADVILGKHYTHHYLNSDALVRTGSFQIELSKTGFINEAGHCLVLYSVIGNRPVIMIFLNSSGKSGRLVDAIAVKNYVAKSGFAQ